MLLVHKFMKIFASQIKKSGVKLPVKLDKSPKIQDNNQAISNGVINEKSNSRVQSKTATGAVRKRVVKSKRKD